MIEPDPAWTLAAPGLAIVEQRLQVNVLRIRRPDEAVILALGEAFELPWPATPNTVAGDALRIAWLAPGEWMLMGAAERVGERVSRACEGRLHHLSAVGAGYRLWRIEGAHARDMLAKGTTLDTHPRVFRHGHCAQTGFAQVHALLIPGRAGDDFDLIGDASFADYIRTWFSDAAMEFRA